MNITQQAFQVVFDYYLAKYQYTDKLLDYSNKSIDQVRYTPIQYYGKIFNIFIKNTSPFKRINKKYEEVLDDINDWSEYIALYIISLDYEDDPEDDEEIEDRLISYVNKGFFISSFLNRSHNEY